MLDTGYSILDARYWMRESLILQIKVLWEWLLLASRNPERVTRNPERATRNQ
jgi:hypothetical protein